MENIILGLLTVNSIITVVILIKIMGKKNEGIGNLKEELTLIIKNEINSSNLENTLKLSKEISINNGNLIEKFNSFQNSLSINTGNNNEKLLIKLGEIEKSISKDLGVNNEKLVIKFGEVEKKLTENLSLNNANLVEKFSNFQTTINNNMGNNNEKLLNKFSEIEKTVSNNLSINNEKLVIKFAEVEKKLTENLSMNNANLVEKFSNFQTIINSNMGNNNEKLLNKFSEIEKTVSKDLSSNNEKLVIKFAEVEKKLNDGLYSFNEAFKKNLDNNVEKLMNTVEFKLNNINEKVEERLKSGFEKTTETFNSIIERLAKIDEAQKNIESLSGNIVSLQDILTDKKSRGIFGEVQLYQILKSVFGEPNDKTYKTQYSFGNGTIADAVLFAPEPVGNLAIDSKFPLENYKKMMDRTLSELERKVAETSFKVNMKKHIDDISEKYIIQGKTADQAILFLPAEAIFAEVHAYYSDLIEYGQKKKVWIASPTTLMAVLNTLQIILRNAEREKYAHIIQEELMKLSQEFGRYKTRWDTLAKDIEKVSKDVREINTTSEKITKRFNSISNAEGMDKLEIEG